MKTLRNKIEATIEKYRDKSESREEIWLDRSYAYQCSDKGVEYEDKTTAMVDVVDNLELALEAIDEFLEL